MSVEWGGVVGNGVVGGSFIQKQDLNRLKVMNWLCCQLEGEQVKEKEQVERRPLGRNEPGVCLRNSRETNGVGAACAGSKE